MLWQARRVNNSTSQIFKDNEQQLRLHAIHKRFRSRLMACRNELREWGHIEGMILKGNHDMADI